MIYFVTSSKDASIYTDYKNQNTGIDPILSLFKYKTDLVDKSSRFLIEFDTTSISQSLASGELTNPTFSLDLKTTSLKELAYSFSLECLPISQSWEQGLGKRADNPKTTDGVSYTWRDEVSGSAWDTEGGDVITSTTSSFSFTSETTDVSFDVTDIIYLYVSGTISNNGLMVRFPTALEGNTINYGEVNFFGSETNTIYRPKLRVEWDDKSLVSGSLSQITDEDTFVTIKNLRKEYKTENQYKFRLHARNMFPTLTYSTGSVYSTTGYVPTGSMYSIVDNVTDDVIVPFGSNSTISIDSNGNYFNQNFKGWEAERYYRILFKIDDGSGIYQLIDKNFVFKLVE